MAVIKPKYAAATTVTISPASLANAAYRQSTAINNSVNRYYDGKLVVSVKTGTSVAATGYFTVWGYGSVDGGTVYTGGASGTDGALTPSSPPNLVYIGTIHAVADSTAYTGGPFPLGKAFGGALPEYFGIVLQNNTGSTASATGGDYVFKIQFEQPESV
jgi:hypothetical protein